MEIEKFSLEQIELALEGLPKTIKGFSQIFKIKNSGLPYDIKQLLALEEAYTLSKQHSAEIQQIFLKSLNPSKLPYIKIFL